MTGAHALLAALLAAGALVAGFAPQPPARSGPPSAVSAAPDAGDADSSVPADRVPRGTVAVAVGAPPGGGPPVRPPGH